MHRARTPIRKHLQQLAGLGLMCLFALQSPAHAAPVCEALFTRDQDPRTLLANQYDQAEILAIGVNDHVNFQAFDHLAELVRERGNDPRLKTIVIEDSYLRSNLYEELSTKELSFDEFQKRATAEYGMFTEHEKALFERVLPSVRDINKQRPNDPILVVSIDGMTNEAVLEIFAPAKPIEHTQSKTIDASKVNSNYASSIRRERDTARNFAKLQRRFPNRKTIVAYQTTHIAKNLRAIGFDVINGVRTAKRSYLGWLSIVRSQIPGDKTRVVVTDNIGPWSTEGVLALPQDLQRPKDRAKAIAWASSDINAFKPKTFLRDYREGSVEVINPHEPVFDAVILEP